MAVPAALRQELDGIPVLDHPGSQRMRSASHRMARSAAERAEQRDAA